MEDEWDEPELSIEADVVGIRDEVVQKKEPANTQIMATYHK